MPGLAIIGAEQIPYIIQTDPLAGVMLVRVRALSALLLVRRICPTAGALLQAEVLAAGVLPAQPGRKKINIRLAGAVTQLQQEHAVMIKPGAIGTKRVRAQAIAHLLNVGTVQAVRASPAVHVPAQTALAAGATAAVQTVGHIRTVPVRAKTDMRKTPQANALKNASAETEL